MVILFIVQSYIVEISIVSTMNDYLPTLVTVALYTWVTHQDPSNSILSICRLYWVFIMRVTSNLNQQTAPRNETLICWLFISRCLETDLHQPRRHSSIWLVLSCMLVKEKIVATVLGAIYQLTVMTDLHEPVLPDMLSFPNKSRDHHCSTLMFTCSRASQLS